MSRFPIAHTYSIVARDPQSGNMGVAVQSHWFSVGSLVGWAEAGVGVVATQSMVEVSYGPLGLALMKAGKTPKQTLNALLAADDNPQVRQVAMVNASGQVAVHTGKRCIAAAGHHSGDGYSVQANMMDKETVWSAMEKAYLESTDTFPNRLMAALFAAQSEGGDIRGKQSAAIRIVSATSSGSPWKDTLIDLRVEDDANPLDELNRLLRIHQAYTFMNNGDEFLAAGNMPEALHAYRSAVDLAPEMTELLFWYAVTLVQIGKVEQSKSLFRQVFDKDPHWKDLLERLPQAGLFNVEPTVLSDILK